MPDYVLEGPKWASHTISWSFGAKSYASQPLAFTSFITSNIYQNVIRAAFARWASVANLNFVEAADSQAVDIRFGYEHIDGPYNILAETSWSSSGGHFSPDADIIFDLDETYSTGANPALSGGVTFYATALHEIGHALGLDHYNLGPAIMNAYASASVNDLQQSDIDGIRALYGAGASMARIVNGTAAADMIYGDDTAHDASLAYDEVIFGNGGADTIHAGGGNDWIWGKAGDNSNTVFYGGAGAVVLVAFGNGTHWLQAGTGDNILIGGGGTNTFVGGAGKDQLWGGAGNNTINAGTGDSLLVGGHGGTNFLYAGGQGGNDILIAGDGRDTLIGGAGADQLWGGAGYDTLVGGAGADLLVAGGGGASLDASGGVADFARNILILGAGADTIITSGGSLLSGAGVSNDDIAWNFNLAQDKITLRAGDHAANVSYGVNLHADYTANYENTGLSGTMIWQGSNSAAGHILLLAGVNTTITALAGAGVFNFG